MANPAGLVRPLSKDACSWVYDVPYLADAPSADELRGVWHALLAKESGPLSPREFRSIREFSVASMCGLIRVGYDGSFRRHEFLDAFIDKVDVSLYDGVELLWVIHWFATAHNWLWALTIYLQQTKTDSQELLDSLAASITRMGLPVDGEHRASLNLFLHSYQALYAAGGCFGELKFERLVEVIDERETTWALASTKRLPTRLVLLSLYHYLREGLGSAHIDALSTGYYSPGSILGLSDRGLRQLINNAVRVSAVANKHTHALPKSLSYPREYHPVSMQTITMIVLAVLFVAALVALPVVAELAVTAEGAYTLALRVPLRRALVRGLGNLERRFGRVGWRYPVREITREWHDNVPGHPGYVPAWAPERQFGPRWAEGPTFPSPGFPFARHPEGLKMRRGGAVAPVSAAKPMGDSQYLEGGLSGVRLSGRFRREIKSYADLVGVLDPRERPNVLATNYYFGLRSPGES